jgi:hypothetical protein
MFPLRQKVGGSAPRLPSRWIQAQGVRVRVRVGDAVGDAVARAREIISRYGDESSAEEKGGLEAA